MNKNINRGITLVALIITIIVLLILAVVTIREITGDGIIAHAKNASKQWSIESEREAISFSLLTYQMADGKQPKLGTELYNKDLYNGERWDMVFTDERNYGTDWNYIEKGTEVADYGKTKYNWVINYNTGEIVYLEEKKYDKLDYTESVAITGEELVMNLDATNLSDENSWTNIENHGKNEDGTGGVTYDKESMALTFDGVDDYLELTKPGDFSNGFTFEMYMNLNRLWYQNNSIDSAANGLFCKMPSLSDDATLSMRFGFETSKYTVAKFYTNSSWNNTNKNMKTIPNGDIIMINLKQEEENYVRKDKYITIVYYRYGKSEPQNEEIVSFMEQNKCDVLAYYIDGALYGYTGYGSDSYDEGFKIWGGDNVPMFIGVCPWYGRGVLYYLQGKVYTVRLYTRPLDSGEVQKNYDQTLTYRDNLKKLEQ